MARKVQMKRRLLREGHRRSPRICALDAKKAQPRSRCTTITTSNTSAHIEPKPKIPRPWGKREGPASRTRAKKKRKLRPLQDVAFPPCSPQDPHSSDEQDGRQTNPGDLQINSDPLTLQSKDDQQYSIKVTSPGQNPITPCVLHMPDKHILQLVIDILQRRDTNEIFAEPVDPNEVEDYYEIIKEPMDFGTMRAKLHEGMYHSLEQFEHDVFLISRNAMHFNSSGTIYFRQARAIDELAKRVFHVLKTDPGSFVLEFSGTRRRTNRKLRGEARSSTYSSSSKIVANSKSNSVTVNISRKPMLSAASSTLNLRTAMRALPGCSGSGITAQFDTMDDEVPFGGREGRGSNSFEADRRSSCKMSWLSVLGQNYSIVSPFYNNSKLLMPVNQQDTGYHESLMRFVKDLGPTAQMIAKRKLNGFSTEATNYLNSESVLPNAPKCNNYVTSSFAQQIPTSMDTAVTIKKPQNSSRGQENVMFDGNKGERAYSGETMGFCATSLESLSHEGDRCSFGAIRLEGLSSIEMKAIGISRSDNFQEKQNSNLHTGIPASMTDTGGMDFSIAGLKTVDEKSTKLRPDKKKMNLASKDYPSRGLEQRLADDYYSLPSSGFDQTIGAMSICDQAVVARAATHELGSSTKTDWTSKSSQPATPVSQFMFGLPFLKTRLDQMNSFGQGRFLQQSSGGQGPFMSETYHDNHIYSPLDTRRTNLALQL